MVLGGESVVEQTVSLKQDGAALCLVVCLLTHFESGTINQPGIESNSV